MLDLYTLLYFPISRKGHIFSVLAEEVGASAKTVKRKNQASAHAANMNFWREYGFLSDEDWEYLQSLCEMQVLKRECSLDSIPEIIREIHPSYLNFVIVMLALQKKLGEHGNPPPLLNDTVEFILTNAAAFSQIAFALTSKDINKYNENIVQLRLPLLFPKEQVWAQYSVSGKIENTLDKCIQEVLLLGTLTFDMVFVTWDLTREDSRGRSALISAFIELVKNPEFLFRDAFYQEVKRHTQRHLELPKLSNQKFYNLLACGNELQEEAVKKQCIRIRKGKHPTPKDLDDFLRKCLFVLGIKENKDVERHLLHYRTQFAHYIMVEAVKHEYVTKKIYPSFQELLEKLIFYREWLCKEVFRCPLPT